MSEKFANQFVSTISDGGDGIDASQTTIGLADSIPSALDSGEWRLVIEDEIILVSAFSGSSITSCTRGAESTTPASHAESTPVAHVITAGSIEEIASGDGYGTYANRPTSGRRAGDIYVCTDSPINYVWSGSEWKNIVPGMGVFDALPSTGWTEGSNPGTITITKEKGLIHMVSSGTDTDTWAWIYRAYSAPIVIEIPMVIFKPTTLYNRGGAGFSDSVDDEVRVISVYNHDGRYDVEYWSGYGGGRTSLNTFAMYGAPPQMSLIKIEDDSTDVALSMSWDGLTFPLPFSETRTTHMTNGPGYWGLGLSDNSGSGADCSVCFLGYRES